MPYQQGNRLPAERASKLGHLEVIQSPLVQKLCKSFNDPEYIEHTGSVSRWEKLPTDGKELKIIFSTDGSIQVIENPNPPFKAIAFVKSALLKVDQYAISKIDKDTPNPFALRDLMKESALYHSTAFPLRNVFIEGKTNFNAVREIMFESVKDKGLNDSLEGAMMETLKWIAFEKWLDTPKQELEEFGCPHCEKNVATLLLDEEKGKCPSCGGEIFITDMFGLHQSMTDDYAPNQVASDYMGVSETLIIFTPIRFYWENKKEILNKCLFVKDGPLSLRATLAKLSAPIRRFFNYAKSQGIEVSMIGQEKTGQFFDHLQLIGNSAPVGSCFIPDNKYIQEQIKHNNTTAVYGADTNYGAKLFVKLNDYHKMIINIPTGHRGEFVTNPSQTHLINFKNIIATLPKILSNRFEGALLPIELANKIASLSTYPSAKVLDLFAESSKTK
ncbi:MAG TPA: hypothetical protein VJB90_03030 [Candidatus Nanoarchaeia archaeon]|nr:hypothetical protein [Candidatus Nanoarchaeia archaeon]